MKTIILLLSLILLNVAVFAQNGIGFQGIARDPNGMAIANTSVSVVFTIGSFSETHSISTDNFGVFSATIGSVNTAAFNNLVFANMNENLKVDVNGTTIYNEKFNSVPYAKAADNGVPPGCIMPYAGPIGNIPAGWLYCDGTSYPTTGIYGKLYQTIGFAWGNDAGKFRVPDLRGYFLRGVDPGNGIDEDAASRTSKYSGGNTGQNVGSYQMDSYKTHNHSASSSTTGNHTHTVTDQGFSYDTNTWMGGGAASGGYTVITTDHNRTTSTAGDHTHTITVNSNGGSETRPENANVYYIIKY